MPAQPHMAGAPLPTGGSSPSVHHVGIVSALLVFVASTLIVVVRGPLADETGAGVVVLGTATTLLLLGLGRCCAAPAGPAAMYRRRCAYRWSGARPWPGRSSHSTRRCSSRSRRP